MDDIIAILRMVERLLVVGFAGLSIFLGYRLFFHLPLEETNKGSLELPGFKIVLSKVGPGVFFSVFGSVVLLQSLHEKVELSKNSPDVAAQNQPVSQHFLGATGAAVVADNDGTDNTPSRRIAVIEQVGELNCSLKMLQSLKPQHVTESMKIAYHDAKISLLRQVWDKDAWGDILRLESAPQNSKISSIFYDTSVACPYD